MERLARIATGATVALCLASQGAFARGAEAPAHPSAPALYSGDAAIELFADLLLLAGETALLESWAVGAPAPVRETALDLDAPPPRPVQTQLESQDGYRQDDGWRRSQRRGRRRDAREGFLFSFGLGGSGLHVSPERGTGAFDFDLRMGYGFSDRFQLYADLAVDSGSYPDGTNISSWMLTARGQTVLIGDRDGNGLNLNAGIGLGGISRSACNGYCDYGYGYGYDTHSAAGFAAGAGLSYDARLGHSFRLSPEFFLNWHQVPNDNGRAADIATAAGFRLNFLWYVQ